MSLSNLKVATPDDLVFSNASVDYFFSRLNSNASKNVLEEIEVIVGDSSELDKNQIEEISDVISFDFNIYTALIAYYFKKQESKNLHATPVEIITEIGVEGLRVFFKSNFIYDLFEKNHLLRNVGSKSIKSAFLFSSVMSSLSKKVFGGCIYSTNISKNLGMITFSCVGLLKNKPQFDFEDFTFESYFYHLANNEDLHQLRANILEFGIPEFYCDIVINFIQSFHKPVHCDYSCFMVMTLQSIIALKYGESLIMKKSQVKICEVISSKLQQLDDEVSQSMKILNHCEWRAN